MKKLPDKKYIDECVIYDVHSGHITWKVRPLTHFKNAHGMNTFNSKFSGKKCLSTGSHGYICIVLQGRSYLMHRVIWKLMTGCEPIGFIDHIDTNKTNNAWSNLRQATKQENAFNTGLSKKNKTGYKGVSFDKARNKYYACIRKDGKTVSLGRHKTAFQAHNAYCDEAAKIHGRFYRG